jgi:hypothetical protein
MKFFDKAVEMTKPVKSLADGLKTCAETIERIASNLAIVAYNQAVHYQLIMQMWDIQQEIYKKLNEYSFDVKMPDIKASSKDDKKPN